MGILVKNNLNEDLQSRVGLSFTSNSFDYIKSTITVEVQTDYNLNSVTTVIKNGNTYTLVSGDNWQNVIGAYIGASIDFRLASSGSPTSTTVASVNGNVLNLTAGSGAYADGVYNIGYFQVTNPLEQFDLKINLPQNSIGSTPFSLIDGEEIRFTCELDNALVVSGGTDTFSQVGNKSGGSIFETKTISRIADTSSGNKQYEIILEYRNWVGINKSPYLYGDCVGQYLKLTGIFELNNPATALSTEVFTDGNTGFEDQNFNTAPSEYTLSSITWTDDSANVMDYFDYSQSSNFSIVITGDINLADDFVFKMFTLPNDDAEYKNKPLPVENNLMLCASGLFSDGSPIASVIGNQNEDGAGLDVQNLTATVVANTSVTITGRVVPNDDFKLLFSERDINDRKYKIWIECEDSTIADFKKSNRVNVLAEFENAQENLLPLGEYADITTFELKDHNDTVFTESIQVYLEDDWLAELNFTLPKSSTNDWNAIKGRVVAERTSNGDRFTLEEYIYNVDQLPVMPDQTLSLDYTEDRGFLLPATSNKKLVIVERDTSADTVSDFGVTLKYPFIVRYEDWLQLPQADNYFFGNKTNNWYTYSSDTDWKVYFEIALETSNNQEYVNQKELFIHDYNDWEESIGSSISFETLSGSPLTKPYKDEKCKVIVEHEVDTEDWNGLEWALIHVRPFEGAPQWLIGSVLDHSDNNNPLEPESGQTKGTLSVTTKIVKIEAIFDPSKIDTSVNVTFTSRVDGSTTGGIKRNIVKETYSYATKYVWQGIRPKTLTNIDEKEEDRGYKSCCTPQLVLADLEDSARYKNDIAAPRAFGDSVSFVLTKDGQSTSYTPTSVQFPSQTDAYYASIEWRDVLNSDGIGCYTITVNSTSGGNIESFTWGTFNLKKYEVDGYYNAKYTTRILSQFNDVNDYDGINYTDSYLLESVRFRGKFGYFQPNTEINNVEYMNGRMEKKRREDFFSYELRSSLVTKCIMPFILHHLRSETSCWMSSYNYDDFDYLDLLDKPVIVKEGAEIEHIDGSRQVKFTAVFEDKQRFARTHFEDNRQTAQVLTPPPANIDTVITPVGAMPLKTGQTTIYSSGDDGDTQRGRLVDFTTLSENNIFGNTNRFTDELGTQVYANNIYIDHSSCDNDKVLGYYYTGTALFNGNWVNSINTAISFSVGTFTSGWSLPNTNEIIAIMNIEEAYKLDYAPFNSTVSTSSWTITTSKRSVSTAFIWGTFQSYLVNEFPKNLNRNVHLYIREFTINGTSLT